MFKSIVIFLFTFLMIGPPAKIKTKKMEIQVERTQFPTDQLDASVKTFKSVIQSTDQFIWQAITDKVSLERQYLTLEGYQRNNDNADVQILANVDQYRETSRDIEEALKKLKGGDGPENKKYRYKFSFSMPITCQLVHQGQVIHSLGGERNFISQGKQEFYSKYYNTSKELIAAAKRSYGSWRNNAIKKHINSKMNAIYHNLNNKYGYKPIKDNMTFFHANSKKHPEHKALETQVNEFKAYAQNIRAHTPIAGATLDGIKGLLATWESEVGRHSFDGDAAKLKEAYSMNLMNGAFAVEEFDMSKKYATLLMNNKKTKRVGRRGLERIENLMLDFKRTGYDTTHPDMSLEDIAPVATIGSEDSPTAATTTLVDDEVRKSQLGLHGGAKEYAGHFKLMTGGEHDYIVVVDHTVHPDIVFHSGTNFKLYKKDGEEYQPYRFDLRRTKEFSIGDRKFKRHGKGAGEVIELVYDTDKMDLYRAHPSSPDQAGIQMTGIWLAQKEGEGMTDLRGLKFMSFKKGFSKWIADCPSVSAKVADQKYKRNEDDLIAIVDEYNSCMN